MTSATPHTATDPPTPRTPRIGLVLTRPDGHVWTWRPDQWSPQLTCIVVRDAAGDQVDRPVQVARAIAVTVFGLDAFQPRIRAVAVPPHGLESLAWSHLYALPCAPGEEPETGDAGDGWWTPPAELLDLPPRELGAGATYAVRALLTPPGRSL